MKVVVMGSFDVRTLADLSVLTDVPGFPAAPTEAPGCGQP